MIAKAILTSSNYALEDKLKQALADDVALVCVNPLKDNLDEVASQFDPDIIIVDSDTRNGTGTTFERFSEIKRSFPDKRIIIVGNESGAQLILMAMRAGAHDFVDQDATEHEIRNVVLRHITAGRISSRSHAGQLVAVMSAQPADENHDLAVNLAVAIAHARPQESVILIDLALPSGGLNVSLDVEIGFCIPDAVKEIARVDRTLLESALARCPHSGLHLLPLTNDDVNVPAIDIPDMAALIEIIKGLYDVVVLYYGPFSRYDTLLKLAANSSLTAIGCNQRFTSIKAANDLSNKLRKMHPTLDFLIAIHEFAPTLSPRYDEISAILGREATVRLTTQWMELTDSINRGLPLSLQASPYRQTIELCLSKHGLIPEKAAGDPSSMSLWHRAKAAVVQLKAGNS